MFSPNRHAMLDAANILETILAHLPDLPAGHALDLRTYKRNRSLLILRTGPDSFHIIQNGYAQATHDATDETMKKLLRSLLKAEFPRSTKVRLYALGEFTPEKAVMKRKKI